MTQYWQFTPVDRIEESTFHPVLERFYKNGISGLIRENIQNSLDGKLKENDDPVTVTIKTGTIDKQHIPGLDEVKERILSLQGRIFLLKTVIQKAYVVQRMGKPILMRTRGAFTPITKGFTQLKQMSQQSRHAVVLTESGKLHQMQHLICI